MARDIQSFKMSLKAGLKYPWNDSSKQWYALWILVPIYGWFALLGYSKKIVKGLVSGNVKSLPAFGSSWDNFVDGLIIFVFMIPTFAVVMGIRFVPILGAVVGTFASIFLLPWLMVNFFVKETFDSLWEIKKSFDLVTDNIGEYLFALLKSLVYGIIYLALSIIIIGIPGLLFGKNYFIADFYRKYK